MQVKELSKKYDYVAPDKSEIRLPLAMKGGGLCHCTLPANGVSLAVKHKTVEEIWYFLSGEGEVWQKYANGGEPVKVGPGTCVTIPVGSPFQFRNTGDEPLCLIISTMLPWPGPDEAERVDDHWNTE